MVRIRDVKYSVSSVPFDLVFDWFLTVQHVSAEGERVTAQPARVALDGFLHNGRVFDTAVIF